MFEREDVIPCNLRLVIQYPKFGFSFFYFKHSISVKFGTMVLVLGSQHIATNKCA